VDGARDELFARAGFSANQDCGVSGRDTLNVLQHGEELRTCSDDLLEVMDRFYLLPKIDVLGL
jgi:hypothetical protein